jgi:hypothetical protein
MKKYGKKLVLVKKSSTSYSVLLENYRAKWKKITGFVMQNDDECKIMKRMLCNYCLIWQKYDIITAIKLVKLPVEVFWPEHRRSMTVLQWENAGKDEVRAGQAEPHLSCFAFF